MKKDSMQNPFVGKEHFLHNFIINFNQIKKINFDFIIYQLFQFLTIYAFSLIIIHMLFIHLFTLFYLTTHSNLYFTSLLYLLIYYSQQIMKKSNYIHYLKQMQPKKGLEVSKTFKNPRKNPNNHSRRNSNPKTKEHKIVSKNGDFSELQRLADKQNHHPNLIKITKGQLNPIPKPSVPQKEISQFNGQLKGPSQFHEARAEFKEKMIREQKFALSLSKCNFEPSHKNNNLFLVEMFDHRELIVCEQCSTKFTKRISLNNFNDQEVRHSYGQLVGIVEKLEEKDRKLGRVMLMQKETIMKTVDEVSSYYGWLIQVIQEKKNQVEEVLIGAYNKNEAIITELIRRNQYNMYLVNRAIEQWQRKCTEKKPQDQREEYGKEEINAIIEQVSKIDQIELSCISQQIPMELLNEFQKDFSKSKYCISLHREDSGDNNEELLAIPAIDPIPQQQEEVCSEGEDQFENPINHEQQKGSIPQTANRVNLSPDYEKQIPFNVEYSATSETPFNFSHKLDEHLSKMSSSEELLIDSLRNHQSYPKLTVNMSAPYIYTPKPQNHLHGIETNQSNLVKDQAEKQLNNLGKGMNFKTESSTSRTLPTGNSCGKQNFVKHLHVDQDDFTDLICDEDLTLSSSHPIHQNPILPRKSLKLSHNPTKRNEPLTVQQLNSELINPQKISQILNPSLISANQNQHEISFELDENMLIDANILPQEIDHENLDIISPAFKII